MPAYGSTAPHSSRVSCCDSSPPSRSSAPIATAPAEAGVLFSVTYQIARTVINYEQDGDQLRNGEGNDDLGRSRDAWWVHSYRRRPG